MKKNDNDSINRNDQLKIDTMGKIGAVLNIVLASIILIFSLMVFGFFSFSILFILFFWTIFILIPLIIGLIFCIVMNARFLKGKGNKITAGVSGVLFGGIIGGILVLLSQTK